MKHLLNNLTEEEKNSIREQHTGGMNVVNENFSKLINTKSGDVKTYLGEQSETTTSGGEKQVSGPFYKKGYEAVKYYVYEKGGKFYIYMTNASQKTPKLFDGTIYNNNGKGYNNQKEAEDKINAINNMQDRIPNMIDKPKALPYE